MMFLNKKLLVVCVAGAVSVAGCSGSGQKKRADEFAVLPTIPLEIPDDVTTLPVPNDGQNLVDKRPKASAIAALGGRVGVGRASAGRTSGDDASLLGVAMRFGVEPDIAEVLYKEGAAARRSARGTGIERAFGYNAVKRAYKNQTLNEEAEAARLLALGVFVPQKIDDE